MAPLPAVAADAIAGWAAQVAAEGRMAGPFDAEARCRSLAGALLGVAPADVALVRNTTDAIGMVTGGLRWRDGDRVVVPAEEFPSNLYPWLALRDRGVVVDVVPLADLAAAIASGGAPTVVAVSWVQYARGERSDLAELAAAAHRRGALLVVDAIQGAGSVPAAMAGWGVDVAVAGGHKWLLGPYGSGVAYVSAAARDRIAPVAPGWASVVAHDSYDDYEPVPWPDARRYEGGTSAEGLLAGLAASMQLLVDAGADAVWRAVDERCDQLVAGLPAAATVVSDRSGSGRSGIVTVALDGVDAPTAARRLTDEHGVVVKARGGGIRFAPHAYIDAEDVDAALRALHAVAR